MTKQETLEYVSEQYKLTDIPTEYLEDMLFIDKLLKIDSFFNEKFFSRCIK